METSNTKPLIGLMCRVALCLSRMYRVFGNNFPVYASYWTNLEEIQTQHVDMMEKIEKNEITGEVFINNEWINESILKTMIENIERITAMAENNKMNPMIAMAYTMFFEESALLNDGFMYISADISTPEDNPADHVNTTARGTGISAMNAGELS